MSISYCLHLFFVFFFQRFSSYLFPLPIEWFSTFICLIFIPLWFQKLSSSRFSESFFLFSISEPKPHLWHYSHSKIHFVMPSKTNCNLWGTCLSHTFILWILWFCVVVCDIFLFWSIVSISDLSRRKKNK